jgi:hypothetical protein
VYNGEQEFRPLPSGGLLPAEHGRNKSNSKAASRPIGDTPDRCSPVVPCRGLALGAGADGASLVEREVGAREGVVLASSGKLGQLQIQN